MVCHTKCRQKRLIGKWYRKGLDFSQVLSKPCSEANGAFWGVLNAGKSAKKREVKGHQCWLRLTKPF